MKRSDLKELYYITPIDNLATILKNGILCYDKSKHLLHKSVADQEVQKRRSKVTIPPKDTKLHSYANLYFNARNPMMRAIVDNDKHKGLAVIQIDVSILDESGIVISDRNASSMEYVRFYPAKEGVTKLDKTLVLTKDWNDPNPFTKMSKKSAACAEVLVPNCIPPKFINGIYVSCQESLDNVKKLLTETPFADKITLNADLFFQ